MKPTCITFFIITSLTTLLLVSSCSESDKKINSKANPEKHSVVSDILPDYELFASPLKDTSKETVWYELRAWNHTDKPRKILFYHCDINYGIRSTGGMIMPQGFECNTNEPYFYTFLPHEKIRYCVKMDRSTIRNPKFYWRMVVVTHEPFKDNFTILDTINLETH